MTYQVVLKSSGNCYPAEEGETLLAAGMRAGFFMPYSCRSGACSTCKGRVLEGQVDYGNVFETALPMDERARGYALMCMAKPLSNVTIEVNELVGTAPIKAATYPCRVVRINKTAPDVAVVKLRLPMNETFFFRAGQYIDILLPDGGRRSYSLAVPPDQISLTHIELHIRHHPGGRFTDHVFEGLAERDMLRFEGPFGSFFLRNDSTKPAILVAGGTGFAPVKAMIEHALIRKVDREFWIYWGGRVRQDLYLFDLARKWAEQNDRIRFIPVLSRPSAACEWSGRTGWVHNAVIQDFPNLSGYEVYACGSPVMVNAARRDFNTVCKLPADAFFADAFLTRAESALSDTSDA